LDVLVGVRAALRDRDDVVERRTMGRPRADESLRRRPVTELTRPSVADEDGERADKLHHHATQARATPEFLGLSDVWMILRPPGSHTPL
jgi:hypothetical protein